MKGQLSFTALGLIISTTALGFATVGPLPAATSQKTVPVRISDRTKIENPQRVYCFNGLKGEPDHLYRGWVCLPIENKTLTN